MTTHPPQIPDQSPEHPYTAQAMRKVALAAFLNVGSDSIDTHDDDPHLFSYTGARVLDGCWTYAVTERELNPIPPQLEHLGESFGEHIYAVKVEANP